MKRFLLNERGAALTEFVITLPIFITIFVGIVNLHKLQYNAARVNYTAATNMWDEAMEIHDTNLIGVLPFEHSIPQFAAVNALGEIAGNPSPQGDMTGQMVQIGMMTAGSHRESSSAGIWVGGGANSYERGADFAQDMATDTFIDPLNFSGKAALMMFNIAVPFSAMGTRHASALGTRYGMVGAEWSETISVPGTTITIAQHYDVMLSPTSVPGGFINELIVVGHSRLAAEDSPCLSSVLKISNDRDYDC